MLDESTVEEVIDTGMLNRKLMVRVTIVAAVDMSVVRKQDKLREIVSKYCIEKQQGWADVFYWS